MDRQNGGRVAVSVFPTFQNNVDINEGITTTTKAEMATQVDPPKSSGDMRTSRPKLFKIIQTFASEFAASYILVFIGCMGCVIGIQGGSIPHEQISWTFGLAILIAVQCCGHLSGSHLNPLVTEASVILGYTPMKMAPVYFTGQVLGSIAGYGSLMLVTPPQYLEVTNAAGVRTGGVCSPGLHASINVFQGLAVEFIVSAMLAFVCCAVWDRKNSDKHDSVAVRFGLTVAGLAMAAGPYTGCNMNPTRSLAPALLNGDWQNHWIYWVGPLAGSGVIATIYKYLFNTPPPEDDEVEGIPLK